MPTILGCPWETYERQPCETWNIPGITGDESYSACGRDNRPGNSQRVGLFYGARETLSIWKNPNTGLTGGLRIFPW